MKSIVALTTSRILRTLAIATLLALPAIADAAHEKVDSDHSTARILLGANAFNFGVARVGGSVQLDALKPSNSLLDLSIDPADGKLITFQSRRATMRPDGSLEISGDLTVSRVVRESYANPAEDYSGPVYGKPTRQSITRKVTFVLPMSDLVGQPEITAEAKIVREDFPELFAAVGEVNWQPVKQDKDCQIPQASEDYSGASCAGTAAMPDRTSASNGTGEGYHGFESAAPNGNQMTIALKLHTTREYAQQATGK
jgi:hypothetical protein